MNPTRREFIKSVGIAIASLVMARCTGKGGDVATDTPGPPTSTPTPELIPSTCYEVAMPTSTPVPTNPPTGARARLRDCWQRLDWLAEQASNLEQGEAAKDQLVAEHRAALDELVAEGELDENVADQVQVAFAEGAYHVWRSHAPITCYEPMLIDYTPTSADQLVRQADILAEMAQASEIDPTVVGQVQAAIERDIAFLSLSQQEIQAMYDRLIEAAGGNYAFPSFDELELEVTPKADQAARFLVKLLLEN